MTITDENTLDDAPGETVALWIRLVRTMDAAMLASFVDRTWRTWSRESLKPSRRRRRRDVPSSKRTKLPPNEANWLPAPKGPFWMAMRLYWPKDEAAERHGISLR